VERERGKRETKEEAAVASKAAIEVVAAGKNLLSSAVTGIPDNQGGMPSGYGVETGTFLGWVSWIRLGLG
jgi:hypothetical protein